MRSRFGMGKRGRDVLVTSTHQQETTRVGEDTGGELLKSPVALKHSLDLSWKRMETLDDLVPTSRQRRQMSSSRGTLPVKLKRKEAL